MEFLLSLVIIGLSCSPASTFLQLFNGKVQTVIFITIYVPCTIIPVDMMYSGH